MTNYFSLLVNGFTVYSIIYVNRCFLLLAQSRLSSDLNRNYTNPASRIFPKRRSLFLLQVITNQHYASCAKTPNSILLLRRINICVNVQGILNK
jgi:hypothetical protein